MYGSPGDHVAACQDLSGRRTGYTYERNSSPGSGSQGLVGDVAGMFLAEVQRMMGTVQFENLFVGKLNLAAALTVGFEGMGKTYMMRLKNTGRLNLGH